jgi:hypothetical protein
MCLFGGDELAPRGWANLATHENFQSGQNVQIDPLATVEDCKEAYMPGRNPLASPALNSHALGRQIIRTDKTP